MTEYENGNDENGLGAADEKKDFACACNSSSVGTAGVFGGGGFAERSSLKFKCESSGSSSQVCATGSQIKATSYSFAGVSVAVKRCSAALPLPRLVGCAAQIEAASGGGA